MTIIVTGAAGFIGHHVCSSLLSRGEKVVGLDNLNSYYDVALKQARLERLLDIKAFKFHQVDISDRDGVSQIFERYGPIKRVVHLAAQAGVRYSIENPMAYVESNLVGQLILLEQCRHHDPLEHFVYASSSSVYGGNTKLPFSVEDPVDRPLSLYAATKRSDELMGYCYSHLYRLPATGLRFFTVYGPWGRPDMAAYLFVDAILSGRPIKLFNNGNMKRDFTYIDDIVSGVVAALDRVPGEDSGGGAGVPHRLYNLGNNHPEPLLKFVALLEKELDCKAVVEMLPMQPGDVTDTYADIRQAQQDLGFAPTVTIEQGLPLFVSWFRDYHSR
jgi:UDP-glucuronate 4-epimerase